MKLIALNDHWAVFESIPNDSKELEPLDAFAALRDLVTMKTYKQLIQFLKRYAVHPSFLVDADNLTLRSFKEQYSEFCLPKPYSAEDMNLSGDLEKVIFRDVEIDLLDEWLLDDLKDKQLFQLSLSDLAVFKQSITCFLTLSAIAHGSLIPEGLFAEIPSSTLYDEDWCNGDLPCKVEELRTFAIQLEKCGIANRSIFGDECFEGRDSVFSHLEKYNRFQLHKDENGIFCHVDEDPDAGKYSNCYPLSIDGVIYEIASFCTGDVSEEDLLSESYYATVTIYPSFDKQDAIRLLSARIVETLLNAGIDYLEGYDFDVPYFDEEYEDHYVYSPDKGFAFIVGKPFPFWVDDLFNKARTLVIEGKVSICPVCNTPVLVRDYRGRKSKEVCSDSCKTIANRERREKAFFYAQSGLPIKEAIEAIGLEYTNSIQKWYDEALVGVANMKGGNE